MRAKRFVVRMLVWGLVALWSSREVAASSCFTPTGSLAVIRDNHTATLLLDGRVLVTGGGRNFQSWSSAELYHPASGTFSPAASMEITRTRHAALLLPGGKVLVTGGFPDPSPVSSSSAELYDPELDVFHPTGAMTHARHNHTMTLLQDGTVLVTGGFDGGSRLSIAEVYDPGTSTFHAVGSMSQARNIATATLLDSGKVLVTGGDTANGSELYDPASESFVGTGEPMQSERWAHTATLLLTGEVLIAGGGPTMAEVYDPVTDTFRFVGPMISFRRGHTATLLPDGRVLLAGGFNGAGIESSVEVYDPATETFSASCPMLAIRNTHTATVLDDGRLLIAGGYDGEALAGAELLDSCDGRPAVTPGASQTALEGESLALTGVSADLGAAGPYSATVDWGDGSPVEPAGIDELTGSLDAAVHAYADDGTYTVRVTVTSAAGCTGSATVDAVVTNAAPQVAEITTALHPTAVGAEVTASASYTDAGILDVHSALWAWGDGTTSAGTVSENGGAGTVLGQHAYASPGVYTVVLTVTDDDGGSGTATYQYVVVYDPSAGFVTGGGWIDSPAGAYAANPALTGRASFGFVARYLPGATVPSGSTEFQFRVAGVTFRSTAYEWLVVAGARAQYKGTGTINGQGSYAFLLTAVDAGLPGGGTSDRFRLKIWSQGGLAYDNQIGAADSSDPATAIGGGSIVIHTR